MKAITIWQPWAQLVAVGAKNYETRSWSTRYRGAIAIHAAKKRDRDGLYWFNLPIFREGLPSVKFYTHLPFGAIVAIGELVAVYRSAELAPKLTDMERAFGNYDP